jgi:hypothetical protein
MLLRATARGASSVAGERDRDTWISLLATPLTAREILWGKWAGCVLGQRGLMILLASVWAIGVVTVSVNPVFLAIVILAFAAYFNAFAWLGIWFSVRARNSRLAIARAVPLAIFLGGGYWIVLGCCCAGIGLSGGRGGDGEVLSTVAAFVAGATPPVVLAGGPAVDSELLRDINRTSRGQGVFGALVLGTATSAVLWSLFARFWFNESLAAFVKETNRSRDELPATTRPTPVPPWIDPPGTSETAEPS